MISDKTQDNSSNFEIEVLEMVAMKLSVFLEVMPCSPVYR